MSENTNLPEEKRPPWMTRALRRTRRVSLTTAIASGVIAPSFSWPDPQQPSPEDLKDVQRSVQKMEALPPSCAEAREKFENSARKAAAVLTEFEGKVVAYANPLNPVRAVSITFIPEGKFVPAEQSGCNVLIFKKNGTAESFSIPELTVLLNDWNALQRAQDMALIPPDARLNAASVAPLIKQYAQEAMQKKGKKLPPSVNAWIIPLVINPLNFLDDMRKAPATQNEQQDNDMQFTKAYQDILSHLRSKGTFQEEGWAFYPKNMSLEGMADGTYKDQNVRTEELTVVFTNGESRSSFGFRAPSSKVFAELKKKAANKGEADILEIMSTVGIAEDRASARGRPYVTLETGTEVPILGYLPIRVDLINPDSAKQERPQIVFNESARGR